MAQAAHEGIRVAPEAPVTMIHGEKQNHFGNTESQICDLVRAADLAASVLETAMTDVGTDDTCHSTVACPAFESFVM